MIEQEMIDKAAKRREDYYHQSLDVLPPLTNYTDDFVYLGHFSWGVRNQRVRLLDRAHLISPIGINQTPGEVARDYLVAKFKKSRPITRGQSDKVNIKRSPPMFAAPGRYDDMIYLDLKAAYWSIVRSLGWNVDYNPGAWLGQGSEMEDFPAIRYKVCRNILVSAGLPSSVTVWAYGDLRQERRFNSLLNMPLWALAQDVLHGVALDMLECGAVYTHTDGYILPMKRATQAFAAVRWWGLNADVKFLGDAVIYGGGRYEIGKSRRLRDDEKHGSTVVNLNPVDREWLRPRFARLARARAKSLGYDIS